MRYRVHLTAYDVLDRVEVRASVFDDATISSERVFELSTAFKGAGESDPAEWLKDALIAALERL